MKLVVWNSQGSKWDAAYTSFTAPVVAGMPADDVVLLLVEAGWAPWVSSGDVTINGWYPLESTLSWYSNTGAATSAFCTAVEQKRRYQALWVPWVKNLNAMSTNSRCSIGAAVFPNSYQVAKPETFSFQNFIRPVIRLQFGKGNKSINVSFVVFLVHMISGVSWLAEQQLVGVMNSMQKLIPEGCAALIVGDMNVNLLSAGKMNNLPAKWSILNTGAATQQSGGELDYGLLYDPNSALQSSTVNVVQQYKSGANQSDHSVLMYNIPLK